MELFSSSRWGLYRPKQKGVVFMFNPKNYATFAWHNFIVVWLLFISFFWRAPCLTSLILSGSGSYSTAPSVAAAQETQTRRKSVSRRSSRPALTGTTTAQRRRRFRQTQNEKNSSGPWKTGSHFRTRSWGITAPKAAGHSITKLTPRRPPTTSRRTSTTWPSRATEKGMKLSNNFHLKLSYWPYIEGEHSILYLVPSALAEAM